MVRIVTGSPNSGKSTRFMQLYKMSNRDTGLFSKKIYNDESIAIGYNLLLLPKEEEIPFISLRSSISKDKIEDYYIQGRFVFDKKVFQIGEQYVLSSLKGTPVWIDEIGGLELKGLGYDLLLHKLLETDVDIVFTVRNSLLEDVLAKYKIAEYEEIGL